MILIFDIKSFILILNFIFNILSLRLFFIFLLLCFSIRTQPLRYLLLSFNIWFLNNNMLINRLHPSLYIFSCFWDLIIHDIFLNIISNTNKCQHRIIIMFTIRTKQPSQIPLQLRSLIRCLSQFRNSKKYRLIIMCLLIPILLNSLVHFISP